MPVGHIIGATFIELDIYGKRFVFSGDVGRPQDYLLAAPEKPEWADYLFLESTYGDRLHDDTAPEEMIIKLVKEIIYNGGTLIIPSFAVERLQTLMYILWKLYKQNKIPNLPIYVDSPMGNNVLSVFDRFPNWHKLPMSEYKAMCNHINIVTSYKETWEVIDTPKSKIVIAGSGMVTGGRVLTYLKQLIDHASTQILLVGYQAEGTRGRQLQEGVHELKLYGKYYPINAQVHQVQSLSAHADQGELLDWLSDLKNIPEKVFLIHGEASASDAFRVKLQTEKSWHIHIPELNEVISLMA
ncbi:MAG: metallo-beta-lactamase family protein [Gammaproteobacteria bacterium]|jgi:metallo-beta-lactamase family protein